MANVFLTQNGRKLLIARQQEIEQKLRAVLSQKSDAYENGGNGWHDNFAFEDLTRQEGTLGKQLSDISRMLSDAVLVPDRPKDNEILSIGHVATLEEDDGKQHIYQVVGYGETDLTTTPLKVEYNSPIIEPFFGSQVGETEEVSFGGKVKSLTLTNLKEI